MNRLKELRREKNLLQKDIANYLNMSQNGYSQYETEHSVIPTKNLRRLAHFYNTSIDYLLNLTNIRKAYSKSNIIPINKDMNRLKEIRENKDLNQLDISKILKMSRNGYSYYETFSHDIPDHVLITLALYYNVPIDYILYTTDERIVHKRNIKEKVSN